jgi:hypothetical protein
MILTAAGSVFAKNGLAMMDLNEKRPATKSTGRSH